MFPATSFVRAHAATSSAFERVQAVLVVPREPVVVRPEPQREREPGESAAAQGALGEQGVALGRQPLERERAESRRRVRQEREHQVGIARGPERRQDVVDAAVEVECTPAGDRQREMLDEMGDASRRRRLVGSAHAEDERAHERRRSLREEDRDVADARPVDLDVRHSDAVAGDVERGGDADVEGDQDRRP